MLEIALKQSDSSKICIVAPGLLGPVTNGGIGAHCHYFATTLAQSSNYSVTVLLTGKVERESNDYWIEYYSQYKISLVIIDQDQFDVSNNFLSRSYEIYLFLKDGNFDQIHFQDWHANGYVAFQAKHSGLAFRDCTFSVSTLSSSEWVRDGMQIWSHHGASDVLLDVMERFCVANADLLAIPTRHMHDWLTEHGWELPKLIIRSPYICDSSVNESKPPAATNPNHLCFYGRLETRKGLELFVDALSGCLDQSPSRRLQISFLGKNATVKNGLSAVTYIYESLAKYIEQKQIEVEIHHQFSAEEAAQYVRDSGAVAVLPSLVDNLPYAILDCIVNRLAFIASDIGGIAEAVDPRALFKPNCNALTQKLLTIDSINFEAFAHHYDNQQARAAWISVCEGLSDLPTQSIQSPPGPFTYVGIGGATVTTSGELELPVNTLRDGDIYPPEYFLVSHADIYLSADNLCDIEQLIANSNGGSFMLYSTTPENFTAINPCLGWIPIHSESNPQFCMGPLLLHRKTFQKISAILERQESTNTWDIASHLDKMGQELIGVPIVISMASAIHISAALAPGDAHTRVDCILRDKRKTQFAMHNVLVPHYMTTKDFSGKALSRRMQQLLDKLKIRGCQQIVIFGFNKYGKEIYRTLLFLEYPVTMIIDANASRFSLESCYGYLLRSPAAVSDGPSGRVYITATDKHRDSMLETLLSVGVSSDQVIHY